MSTKEITAKQDLTGFGEQLVESSKDHKEIVELIKTSFKLKPKNIIISEIKWKYLIRQVLRGKNIMMTGHSGTGKTMTAFAVADALGRNIEEFNLGDTTDARTELIGNTQFNPDEGTFFNPSDFVKAITTPNTIILLDELTRAHHDAWNILMPVLDIKQRYLRLSDRKMDDGEINRKIQVAEGVSFIATANIGHEYTATNELDRALKERFTIVETDILNMDQEYELLKSMYPTISKQILKAISKFADEMRSALINGLDDGDITTLVSTRMTLEMASLVYDGFSFLESAQSAVIPFFPEEEREYVNMIIQGLDIMDDDDIKKLKLDEDGPFITEDEARVLTKGNAK